MPASQPVKRRLLGSDDETLSIARLTTKRRRTGSSERHPEPRSAAARLLTITKDGVKEAIVVSVGKPVIIGRNASRCTYVIPDGVVSNIHFKIHAIPSAAGSVLLTCQDLSTNGIRLNDHLMKKCAFILNHGDVIKIPRSQDFQCVYSTPRDVQKRTLFDPTPPLIPRDKVVGEFRITSCILGTGTFATVYLAYMPLNINGISSFKQVACKVIKIMDCSEDLNLAREVELLKDLKHPNINRILSVLTNDGFMNIFLELCTGGDLFTYITCKPLQKLNEGEAKYCGYQLMLGLEHLHDRNISHRDLKPENILLHTPGPYPRLIIADFGLARPRSHEHTLNAVGTISYMPPEAIMTLTTRGFGYVGIYADAWSLGMVLFVMLCGYNLFDYNTSEDNQTQRSTISNSESLQLIYSHKDAIVMSRIVESSAAMELQSEQWSTMPYARDLIRELLIQNPKQRQTVRGALKSRWIQMHINDLEEGYHVRIVSDDLLFEHPQ